MPQFRRDDWVFKSKIFCNEDHLDFGKIKRVGFDMDYTLIQYKSPTYETMVFELMKEELIRIGYPERIREYVYDESDTCTRGTWVSLETGHLLTISETGRILRASLGFTNLSDEEIEEIFPSHQVIYDPRKYFIYDTAFNLPEMQVFRCLVHYFLNNCGYEAHESITKLTHILRFSKMQADVRAALDNLFIAGKIQSKTFENIDEYVDPDDGEMARLISRFDAAGVEVLLITNSGYDYTRKLMGYFFKNANRPWNEFFDLIIVDAKKPSFWREGTPLKEVNMDSGAKSLEEYVGHGEKHHVYSGGNSSLINTFLMKKVPGDQSLYVGDHLVGDVVEPRKFGWKTMAIVREIMYAKHPNGLIWYTKEPADHYQVEPIYDLTYFGKQLVWASIYSFSPLNLLLYKTTHKFRNIQNRQLSALANAVLGNTD